MEQGEAHVMSLLTIKGMADKKDERKVKKQKKKEEDLTYLAAMTLARYKPESLDSLCKATKFNRRELQIIYRGFKQECPAGVVNEDTFKQVYGQFFPQGDASNYAHLVFRALDKDNHGCVTFEEFIQALSDLSYGSFDDKLRWTFSLYDQDGDGVITRNELEHVVASVYSLMGTSTYPTVDQHMVKRHVDNVLQQVRCGDTGITYDTFSSLCKKETQSPPGFTQFTTDLRLRH